MGCAGEVWDMSKLIFGIEPELLICIECGQPAEGFLAQPTNPTAVESDGFYRAILLQMICDSCRMVKEATGAI